MPKKTELSIKARELHELIAIFKSRNGINNGVITVSDKDDPMTVGIRLRSKTIQLGEVGEFFEPMASFNLEKVNEVNSLLDFLKSLE